MLQQTVGWMYWGIGSLKARNDLRTVMPGCYVNVSQRTEKGKLQVVGSRCPTPSLLYGTLATTLGTKGGGEHIDDFSCPIYIYFFLREFKEFLSYTFIISKQY